MRNYRITWIDTDGNERVSVLAYRNKTAAALFKMTESCREIVTVEEVK